jgi:hypothetical protein
MDRLTTDKPFDYLEAICNMVYPVDGWAFIRTSMDESKPITDFCLHLCKCIECTMADSDFPRTEEDKDAILCGCAGEGCPIANVYAALSGYSHLRDRLKMYEDAGMWPPQEQPALKPLEWEEIPDHKLIFMELRGIDKPVPSILRQTMDNQAWYTMESGYVFTFDMDELGKRWRPWAIEPTEEERAAAPWEDADNADQ